MNGVEMIVSYLVFPAVLTVIMEMPVLLIGFKDERYSIKYKLLIFALVNVITNLTLNSSILIFRFERRIVIIAEILIIITEALIYRRAFLTRYGRAFLNSFLANAFSGIIGSYLIELIIH